MYSCGEARLEKNELDMFKGQKWLNDNCIHFWMEHMFGLYKEKLNDIIFLSPTSVFALQFMDLKDVLAETHESVYKKLALREFKVSFIPIISNANIDSGGGSHWSLLLCVNKENDIQYLHFDSSGRSNDLACSEAVTKLKVIMKDSTDIKINNIICTQQTNSYDCGVFVCGFCFVLCSRFIKSNFKDLNSKVNLNKEILNFDTYRSYMLNIIISKYFNSSN